MGGKVSTTTKLSKTERTLHKEIQTLINENSEQLPQKLHEWRDNYIKKFYASTNSKKIKVIFLDVDGVLNNAKTDVSQLYMVEPDLLTFLKQIIGKVTDNTIIVLSTTWRYTIETRTKLLKFFFEAGLPPYFCCTPSLGTTRVEEIACWITQNINTNEFNNCSLKNIISKCPEDLPSHEYLIKAQMIHLGIDTDFTDNKFELIGCVILDDMDLTEEIADRKIMSFVKNHFVLVNKLDGLTEADCIKATNIINQIL